MQITDVTIDDCWNKIGVWRSAQKKCPELDKVLHCRNCPVFSRAGRKLLRLTPPADYRDESTRIIAAEKTTKPANLKSAFVFRAGSEWLALPARLIYEVVSMGPIHSIPHITSKTLRGLVNIHGRLQICVSIGRALGIEKQLKAESGTTSAYIPPARLIVVLQENRQVAFPVSEVRGIIRYTPEMVKDLPVTVSGSKAAYTEGILHVDGKDIGLLKDKPLFQTIAKDFQ